MTAKILCVDDDPNILQAYKRALRKQFDIEIALGGAAALETVATQGPFAVVVADMQMPGMNGVELLRHVRKTSPDTVRMMLTGNADQQTALEAVNEGHIFRFMTKPCPPESFAKALDAAVSQYQLIRAERDLLSKTFSASVKVLTDVLSLVNPLAFGKASRVRKMAHEICQGLGLKDWEIEVAAMVSQIGCVSIPESILRKAYEGELLDAAERKMFEAYPLSGSQLIGNIPRLERVAEIIAYQQQHFDGGGFPGDGKCGDAIPLGSRILKVALDYDTLVSNEYSREMALAEINHREGWYDPSIIVVLRDVLAITNAHVVRRISVHNLIDGLIVAEDVKTTAGAILCAKGQEITRAMRIRLRNFQVNIGMDSFVRVFVPLDVAGRPSLQDAANTDA